MTFAGVGKTVIAAFDYKKFRKENPRARLLIVAHRKEILEQSIHTFQEILNDFNFGELYVDGRKPTNIEHLFISIQSFNSAKLSLWTTDDYYDYICVDEFHHAADNSYQELLAYYKPKILLGLTATPDRMDGKDILKYFDAGYKPRYYDKLYEIFGKKYIFTNDLYGIGTAITAKNNRNKFYYWVLDKFGINYATIAKLAGSNHDEWWPTKEEYDPGITKEQWLKYLDEPGLFTENSYAALAAFFDIGGEATAVQLSNRYGNKPDFYRSSCT